MGKVSLKKKETEDQNMLDEFLDMAVKDSSIERMSDMTEPIVVPTNIPSYNRATVVGGLTTGGTYSLCGKSQGGKTVFGILCCNMFAQAGYPSLHIDAELTADKIWFRALGLNLNKSLYLAPSSLEHASEEVDGFINKHIQFREKVGKRIPALIVVDSYNKLRPADEMKNTIVEGKKYPLHALLFTDWLNRLTLPLSQNDIAFMVVRHDRANMKKKGMYDPDTVSSGAESVNHESTFTIRFSESNKDKIDVSGQKRLIGFWHKFIIEKNKDGIRNKKQ